MPGFNVQEFKSVIEGNRGLLRNNKFLVEFPPPRKLQGVLNLGVGAPFGNVLSFYCKGAALPGLGLLTSDVYRYGYGPIERRPYGTVYNDEMMHFYVDANNQVRRWFRQWTRLIVNCDMQNGITSKNNVTGQDAYEFSYKSDYAVDIRITSFDPEGNQVISVVLCEAYPNYIGDTMQDWDDKNSNMLMPVSFTYRDWYEENSAIGDIGSIMNQASSVQSTLQNVASAAQFISSLI